MDLRKWESSWRNFLRKSDFSFATEYKNVSRIFEVQSKAPIIQISWYSKLISLVKWLRWVSRVKTGKILELLFILICWGFYSRLRKSTSVSNRQLNSISTSARGPKLFATARKSHWPTASSPFNIARSSSSLLMTLSSNYKSIWWKGLSRNKAERSPLISEIFLLMPRIQSRLPSGRVPSRVLFWSWILCTWPLSRTDGACRWWGKGSWSRWLIKPT